jgi:hypothetical protein
VEESDKFSLTLQFPQLKPVSLGLAMSTSHHKPTISRARTGLERPEMAENTAPRNPKYPPGLKPRGRQVWREIHAVYDFEDAPEKRIVLEEACRTADVTVRLQAVVDQANDLRVKGSQGQPVAMPEVAELRQYRALLTTLMRALTLPGDDDVLTRSDLGRMGAAGRWKSRG